MAKEDEDFWAAVTSEEHAVIEARAQLAAAEAHESGMQRLGHDDRAAMPVADARRMLDEAERALATTRATRADVVYIAAVAAQVGSQRDELDSAIDAERTAEAAVLDAAIEAARPALRAICSLVDGIRGVRLASGHFRSLYMLPSVGGAGLVVRDYSSPARERITPTTAREAMDDFDLELCLAALSDALERQLVGKAPERSKAARARAEKLRAMLALVRP